MFKISKPQDSRQGNQQEEAMLAFHLIHYTKATQAHKRTCQSFNTKVVQLPNTYIHQRLAKSLELNPITPLTFYTKTLVSVFQDLPSPFHSSTHPASLARLLVMTFLRRPQEHSLLRHTPIHQSHSPGVAPNLIIPRHAPQEKDFDDGKLSLHQE